MRIVVFGATGGTGRQVVEEALDGGHEVVAVARDPARVPLAHKRLRVVRGDALEPATVLPALAGADAVVSALGTRSQRGPVTLYSVGTGNVLQAMRAAGVTRLVVVSAAPAAPRDPADTLPYRLLLRPLIRALFGRAYADMARMEEAVRHSGLRWTVVRPPRLTDGPRTGRYRIAFHGSVPGGYFISRADLADAILRLLDDPAAVDAAVGVAY